jgi:hypothetical protein
VAVLIFYRSYSGIGRFVPLGQQDAAYILMLDTTTGAVYSVEKQDGNPSSPWKMTVPPLAGKMKLPFK